jgi:acetolactate synthase I/II/III large subunit
MARDRKSSVGRRDFLKRAAVAGAGVAAVPAAPAGAAQSAAVPAQRGPVQVRGNLDAREETPPVVDGLTQDNCGADFMVDVIKSLGLEYVVGNT